MASMGQKYLVVSDNHGNMSNLEYVIERFRGKIEALIHCGDMEIPPEMLEELAGCPVYMAEGNCDYNFSRDKEDIFELGDDTFVGYFSSSPKIRTPLHLLIIKIFVFRFLNRTIILY